jgi:glutathione peroxidase
MLIKSIRYIYFLLALSFAISPAAAGVLDHKYRTLAGKKSVDLQKTYGGKVLLVVNTASKCGYTPQFEALEAMNSKYAAQGFSVLGFPSNDFMGQDPGSEKEIKDFCTLTYGVKFPMFEKVQVKGNATTGIYRDLKAATGDVPGWNFHKFIIDRDGKVIGSFPSKIKPDDPQIVKMIETALKAKAAK